MTAVQLLALSTPAVIGAALLTLAYWVRNQNRSPILSSGIAEVGAAEWTSQARRETGTSAPPTPAEAHDDSLDEMSRRAELEKMTNIKVVSFAISIANLTDAERALADLQRFVSTARIASRTVRSE